MKILQIINNLSSGGAEKLVSEITPLMKKREVEIEVLLLKKEGSIYIDKLNKSNIKTTILSDNKLFSLTHIYKIINYINKNDFDIIHVHLFPALYFIAFASFFIKKNIPLFYTEHSTTNRRRNKKIFEFIDRFIYRRYSNIICISDNVSSNLQKHLRISSAKFTICPNGINLSLFNSENNCDKSKLIRTNLANANIITMVGRFCKAKDQQTLIRAINLLDQNFHLLLIGKGETQKKCEELVASLGISNRVHFLGERNDVPDILRISDIGVLSSNWEGMPLSTIEIMASQIPFIGSNVPGIKDLIQNKYNAGLLFERGDEHELKELILKLLTNSEIYKNQIENGKKFISEYDINIMVDNYLLFYKEAIDSL